VKLLLTGGRKKAMNNVQNSDCQNPSMLRPPIAGNQPNSNTTKSS